MPAHSAPFLIVAITGRALAESAARDGYQCAVLDCFGDADTAAASSACRSIVSAHGLRFDRPRLLREAWEVAPLPGIGLVYGAGFEGRIDLLQALALERTLYGNPPETVARIRDPRQFFALLDQWEMPHPEVTFTRPPKTAGWLIKQPGSAGGMQVQPAARHPGRQDSYWQRLEPGDPMSVLFLADGRRAAVIGFNRQHTEPLAGHPFAYGGAVSRVTLPPSVETTLRARLDALVGATGLRGLNGLDFLLHDDRWSVLELNPRPTATMELYDADYTPGLFHWHLQGSLGLLPEGPVPSGPARASRIARAERAWTVPSSFAFPAWCHDRPQPGTRFSPGDPVCTVVSEATTPAAAESRATQYRQQLGELIAG
jgi:predicted ATP-grasp superfamily ATP-dependent carboligase